MFKLTLIFRLSILLGILAASLQATVLELKPHMEGFHDFWSRCWLRCGAGFDGRY